MSMELTIPEEITRDHVDFCNTIHPGYAVVKKDYLFKYPIGTIISTTQCFPRNIIGTIFGYIFCPITNSYRAVLGINCDVSLDLIREANDKEILAYFVFSKGFDPVEQRMIRLI